MTLKYCDDDGLCKVPAIRVQLFALFCYHTVSLCRIPFSIENWTTNSSANLNLALKHFQRLQTILAKTNSFFVLLDATRGNITLNCYATLPPTPNASSLLRGQYPLLSLLWLNATLTLITSGWSCCCLREINSLVWFRLTYLDANRALSHIINVENVDEFCLHYSMSC